MVSDFWQEQISVDKQGGDGNIVLGFDNEKRLKRQRIAKKSQRKLKIVRTKNNFGLTIGFFF